MHCHGAVRVHQQQVDHGLKTMTSTCLVRTPNTAGVGTTLKVSTGFPPNPSSSGSPDARQFTQALTGRLD